MVTRDEDERFMREAIKEARKAYRRGEIPVGAVVVRQGIVIGSGHNTPLRANDPTAHAEVVALRKAARKMKNYRLAGCRLYVTLEPCPMCMGAAIQARIADIVYGAPDPKTGAAGSVLTFPYARLPHRVEVRGGVLAGPCGELVRRFLQGRRKKPSRLLP